MNFLNEDNKQLLLGVIRNTHPISNEYHIEQLKNFFNSQSFDFDRTKVLSKSELLNINKMYIAYIVNAIKKKDVIPQQKIQQQSVTFINDTIFKPSMEGITAEELQNKKREQFNDELSKKQQEFSQFIQKPILPKLNFNEDKDTPISEMEKLINLTIAQRALDFAQFKQIHPPPPQPTQQMSNTSFVPKLITINTDVDDDISSDFLKPIILDSNKNISLDDVDIDVNVNVNNILHNRLNILEDKIDTIIQLLRLIK